MNRRGFLQKTAFSLATIPIALPLQRFHANPTLHPVVDQTTGLELIKLPAGFTYRSMSWTGEKMETGGAVPPRHDGMGLVDGATPQEQVLLRNHELYSGEPINDPGVPVYDDFQVPPALEDVFQGNLSMAGGVTGVVLENGEFKETTPLLGGTMVNCAGGVTPWGTWLTCEEIVFRGSNMNLEGGLKAKDHGYVFEVPPLHLGKSSAKPIKDMGLFRHEAVAIDPNTGFAYLTEDNGPNSGFYRFVPSDLSGQVGSLEKGGELFMLRVKGEANVNLTNTAQNTEFEVDWVPISNPDSDPAELISYGNGLDNVGSRGKSGPYMEGENGGGAQFSRGEGIWEHDGFIYWVDTAGGPNGTGSVWVYDGSTENMRCIFASKSERHADAIDNIAVNPVNGRLILCEDGGGVSNTKGALEIGSRLLLSDMSTTGVAPFAENNMDLRDGVPGHAEIVPGDYRGTEWAGAVFSKDGQTLFANLQIPGITLAITGPWNTV